MFCSKCGTELDGEYCYNCGAKSLRYNQHTNTVKSSESTVVLTEENSSETVGTSIETIPNVMLNNKKETVDFDSSSQPDFYSGRCVLCGMKSDLLNLKNTCPTCQEYVNNVNQESVPEISEKERKKRITRDLIVGGIAGLSTFVSSVIARTIVRNNPVSFLIMLLGVLLYIIYRIIISYADDKKNQVISNNDI